MFAATSFQNETRVSGYGSVPLGAPEIVPERLPQALQTRCRRYDHAAISGGIGALHPADTSAGSRSQTHGGQAHQ